MGFISRNGKKLSDSDVRELRKIYHDLLEDYFKVVATSDKVTLEKDEEDPVSREFQGLCNQFLRQFDERNESAEDFSIEDFYDAGMTNIYQTFASCDENPEKRNDPGYRTFYSQIGKHFQSRYIDHEKKNTDLGLLESMSSFKLTNAPLPGIAGIPDFDPNVEYDDPFIEARQANSGTYANLRVSGDQEKIDKASNDFKVISRYSQTAAAQLMAKDNVGFGDIYGVFKVLNTFLLDSEGVEGGGRIRTQEIGAGSLEGIDSVAIPQDIFMTFSKVADYMNEIKRTPDPMLRKSQAVQLAAFTYQLAISEHIFGNGNGRSCRFLSDTILQAFGLPPQVPTYALIGTGATIGNKLDFDKGTQCFMRGLTLTSDLMSLNRNEEIRSIDQKARTYLTFEHLDPEILENASPSMAVGLAVQSGECRYSLSAYLDDFIKADHFGSMNSKQYKGLIQTAKNTLNVLSSESVYSRKSAKAISNLEKAITEYEAHCRRHPRKDATRTNRLKALESIKKSVANAKDVSLMISEIEAVPFKNGMDAMKDEISNVFTDDMLNSIADNENMPEADNVNYERLIGKYILMNTLIKEVSKQNLRINFEEAVSYSGDEAQIDHIVEGDTIKKAIEAEMRNPAFGAKTMKEKLDGIADRYVTIKTMEIAAERPQEFEGFEIVDAQKINMEPEAPADIERKTIMSYMIE